jgi:hypothetical protein
MCFYRLDHENSHGAVVVLDTQAVQGIRRHGPQSQEPNGTKDADCYITEK